MHLFGFVSFASSQRMVYDLHYMYASLDMDILTFLCKKTHSDVQYNAAWMEPPSISVNYINVKHLNDK